MLFVLTQADLCGPSSLNALLALSAYLLAPVFLVYAVSSPFGQMGLGSHSGWGYVLHFLPKCVRQMPVQELSGFLRFLVQIGPEGYTEPWL